MRELRIEYRPYKFERYLALFFLFGFVFMIYFSDFVTSFGERCVSGTLAVLCIIFMKITYDVGKTIVYFESAGIRSINDGTITHQYTSWKDLKYAYYVINYKGFVFLLLSPKDIRRSDRKKIVNKCCYKMCKGNMIVISMRYIKEDEAKQIKSLIYENGLIVESD